MRFESDLGKAREEPLRLKSLKEELDNLLSGVQRLREFRRDLNEAQPMPFEEFVRSQRHVQRVTKETRDQFEEAHNQHVQVQERKRQEAQSRLENARQRLKDTVASAKQKADSELEQQQHMERTLRRLVETLGATRDRLDVGAMQLTLEQVSQLENLLEQHDWLKRTV